MRRHFAVIALLAVGAARAELAWPELPLPEGARAQTVTPDAVVNGRHSRILRASVPGSVDDALAFYREHFGKERVENPVRGASVIASRQGGFFNTVQLRQLVSNSVEATIISTAVDGPAELSRVMQDSRRLLPADSTLMNSMESNDGGRRSVMLTALNSVDLQTNRDELVRGLRQRGMKVSREERGKVGEGRTLTLWADNAQEQTTATVIDTGAQRMVVLNRVREVKR